MSKYKSFSVLDNYDYDNGDASNWCIKGYNKDIATNYTFNKEDPSFPYCKIKKPCKYKIKNYFERPVCEFMHKKYEKDIIDFEVEENLEIKAIQREEVLEENLKAELSLLCITN